MVRPTGDALQRSAHRGGEEPSHRGEGCAAPRRVVPPEQPGDGPAV